MQRSDGTRVASNVSKNSQEGEGKSIVEYIIPNPQGKMNEYKVVITVPTGIAKIPVKFEFENLDLP